MTWAMRMLDDEKALVNLLESKDKWTEMMKDPIFLGLMQNKEYNEIHPDRWNLKPY